MYGRPAGRPAGTGDMIVRYLLPSSAARRRAAVCWPAPRPTHFYCAGGSIINRAAEIGLIKPGQSMVMLSFSAARPPLSVLSPPAPTSDGPQYVRNDGAASLSRLSFGTNRFLAFMVSVLTRPDHPPSAVELPTAYIFRGYLATLREIPHFPRRSLTSRINGFLLAHEPSSNVQPSASPAEIMRGPFGRN